MLPFQTPTPHHLYTFWKERIKIRAERNEIKSKTNKQKTTLEQIDETRIWFFKNINKSDKHLATFKKKRERERENSNKQN